MPYEERCSHDFLLNQCALCKVKNDGVPEIVYTTKAGDVFHRRPTCEALKSGQDMAYTLGNLNYEIKPINRTYAENLGRCEWCFSSLNPKINKPCEIKQARGWIKATLLNKRFIGNGYWEYLVNYKNNIDEIEELVVRKSMIRF